MKPRTIVLLALLAFYAVFLTAIGFRNHHHKSQVKNCLAKSTPAGNATALAEHEAWCELHPDKPIILDPSKVQPIGK